MDDRIKILELLSSKKNVLLMGAPGTGKSRVMNEVAEAFINGGTRLAQPSHVPGAGIPPCARGICHWCGFSAGFLLSGHQPHADGSEICQQSELLYAAGGALLHPDG